MIKCAWVYALIPLQMQGKEVESSTEETDMSSTPHQSAQQKHKAKGKVPAVPPMWGPGFPPVPPPGSRLRMVSKWIWSMFFKMFSSWYYGIIFALWINRSRTRVRVSMNGYLQWNDGYNCNWQRPCLTPYHVVFSLKPEKEEEARCPSSLAGVQRCLQAHRWDTVPLKKRVKIIN